VIIPLLSGRKINIRFNYRDLMIGLIVSFIILLPSLWYLMFSSSYITLPPINIIIFHLFMVSLPEEIYFRGFLQESMGNNIKDVVIVSILFSIIHLPKLIFDGDLSSALTFFPSLVMGYLYMKTSNILPSAIFHFTANIIFTML
jgi:membrane protease YdiL (CAAX protease family)